ncbi:MAG: hypothetical protein QOF21_3163 [Actinomycetota bacterium]
MDKSQIWPTIHAERKALAADLENLTYEQWATPSLCDGWTVRDVLAHMTGTAQMTPAKFFPRLIASGFSLPRLQDKDIKRIKKGDTLTAFKGEVNSSSAPPGPRLTWLGETLVHGDDIRRAVGIKYDYPPDATAAVADSYKGSNLVIGAKKRIAGLKLVATDTDWTHGDGPEVRGPMIALLMVMAGREAALSDLSGDGVATLQQRLT